MSNPPKSNVTASLIYKGKELNFQIINLKNDTNTLDTKALKLPYTNYSMCFSNTSMSYYSFHISGIVKEEIPENILSISNLLTSNLFDYSGNLVSSKDCSNFTALFPLDEKLMNGKLYADLISNQYDPLRPLNIIEDPCTVFHLDDGRYSILEVHSIFNLTVLCSEGCSFLNLLSDQYLACTCSSQPINSASMLLNETIHSEIKSELNQLGADALKALDNSTDAPPKAKPNVDMFMCFGESFRKTNFLNVGLFLFAALIIATIIVITIYIIKYSKIQINEKTLKLIIKNDVKSLKEFKNAQLLGGVQDQFKDNIKNEVNDRLPINVGVPKEEAETSQNKGNLNLLQGPLELGSINNTNLKSENNENQKSSEPSNGEQILLSAVKNNFVEKTKGKKKDDNKAGSTDLLSSNRNLAKDMLSLGSEKAKVNPKKDFKKDKNNNKKIKKEVNNEEEEENDEEVEEDYDEKDEEKEEDNNDNEQPIDFNDDDFDELDQLNELEEMIEKGQENAEKLAEIMSSEKRKKMTCRLFWKMIWMDLKSNNPVLSVFTVTSIIKPFYFRFVSLMLSISLTLFFNALFFSPEYIKARVWSNVSVSYTPSSVLYTYSHEMDRAQYSMLISAAVILNLSFIMRPPEKFYISLMAAYESKKIGKVNRAK